MGLVTSRALRACRIVACQGLVAPLVARLAPAVVRRVVRVIFEVSLGAEWRGSGAVVRAGAILEQPSCARDALAGVRCEQPRFAVDDVATECFHSAPRAIIVALEACWRARLLRVVVVRANFAPCLSILRGVVPWATRCTLGTARVRLHSTRRTSSTGHGAFTGSKVANVALRAPFCAV